MGQIENAIERARRNTVGKDGPWRFEVLTAVGKHNDESVGTLYHYGTPIFRVNLKTGEGLVGQGAWGSVSDQTGIRKAAKYLSQILGGQITVSALSKKEILEKRDRARAKGQAFSNPSGLPSKKAGAFRMGSGHVHIGKGLVYCPEAADSKPAVITHSRVKCGFCGKTIQSATNPPGEWERLNIFPSKTEAVNYARQLNRKYQDIDLHFEIRPPTQYVKAWSVWFRNDKRKNPPTSPVAHFMRRELMDGRTPAQALRSVAQQFAGRIPRAALTGAFNAVRAELVDGLESGDRSGMSDWAGKAAMRMSTYRKFSRNPARGLVGSPALIYGRAKSLSFNRKGQITQMTARKTEGPYKGESFVHDFKPGVRHLGLPRGTEVTAPGGRTMKLKTRAALMVGPRDIWRNFAA